MDQRAQMLSPAGMNPHKHQIIQSRLDFGASTGHGSGTGSYKLGLSELRVHNSVSCLMQSCISTCRLTRPPKTTGVSTPAGSGTRGTGAEVGRKSTPSEFEHKVICRIQFAPSVGQTRSR